MRRPARHRTALMALGAAASLVLGACASPEGGGGGEAEEGAEVPDNVTLVIPYDPGGGTDTWARFMVPYLSETVEGEPTFTPENRPGGESITGSNQFVTSGGTDGSELLVTSGTTYFQYLLGREEVEFDFTEMEPLVINGTGGVIYASAEAGIDSVEDLKNPPEDLVYGGISATGLDLNTLLAFDLLGLDVDTTFGFEGRGPALLALQRGEINLDYQTTSAYNAEVLPMVEDGDAVPLMSFGVLDENGEVVRDPNLPDLPTVEEVYEQLNGEKPSGTQYEAYRSFLAAGYPYQKGIWANAGTPDSVTEPFYDAADELSEDEEFNEKGEEALGGYPLYSGKEVEDRIMEAFQIDEDARAYVLDLLAEKYETDLR
jgi:tripartite-type tricarboxylate transporter receptor subunit TctC